MDTASVLEQYTQDLSNLPAELAHLLTELREKDMKYYETRKRIQQRDNQIHKYIKQFGSLQKNPKEQQIYSKMNEDFDTLTKLQEEKCIISNTALFLITKHLTKLEKDIETLENEGLLLPLELLEQEQSLTSLLSSINSLSLSSSMKGSHKKQSASTSRKNLSSSTSRGSTPAYGTPARQKGPSGSHKRQTSEELSLYLLNTPSLLSSSSAITQLQLLRHPQQLLLLQLLQHSHLRLPPLQVLLQNQNADLVHLLHSSPGAGPLDLLMRRKNLSQPPPPPANLVLLSSMHPSSLEVSITGPGAPGGGAGEEDELYCFCRQVSFGNMIACDNSNCKFEWFHYDCVGLKEPPQGTWYCPDCSKIMLNKKGRKKK